MSGNAVTFLAEYENVSPIQAGIWIKERFDAGEKIPDRSNILDNVKEILKKPNRADNLHKIELVEETEAQRRRIDWKSARAWLKYSGPDTNNNDIPIIYMLERGFEPTTLDKFEIGWDKITERISIPIRDEEGRLLGFKGRAIEGQPRYIVLGGPEFGFEPYLTKKVLFGLDKVKETDQLIVCEGELNAIAMHQHGYPNTVGISGKVLSDEQVELIKKYARSVVFIFDEEEDAIAAAKKTRRFLPTSIVPNHDKDPADMSRQEVMSLLDRRRSSLISLD